MQSSEVLFRNISADILYPVTDVHSSVNSAVVYGLFTYERSFRSRGLYELSYVLRFAMSTHIQPFYFPIDVQALSSRIVQKTLTFIKTIIFPILKMENKIQILHIFPVVKNVRWRTKLPEK